MQWWDIIRLGYWVAAMYETQPSVPSSTREVGICPSPWAPPLSCAARACWSSPPGTQRKWCTRHWGTALWWVRSSCPTTCLHLHNDRALRHISPAASPPGPRPSLSSEPKRWLQGGTDKVHCSRTARSPAVGNGTTSSGGLKPAQYTWRESRQYIDKTTLDKASMVTFPWLLGPVSYQWLGKFCTPYLKGEEVLCSSPTPPKPMWFSCHNSFNSLFFNASQLPLILHQLQEKSLTYMKTYLYIYNSFQFKTALQTKTQWV